MLHAQALQACPPTQLVLRAVLPPRAAAAPPPPLAAWRDGAAQHGWLADLRLPRSCTPFCRILRTGEQVVAGGEVPRVSAGWHGPDPGPRPAGPPPPPDPPPHSNPRPRQAIFCSPRCSR